MQLLQTLTYFKYCNKKILKKKNSHFPLNNYTHTCYYILCNKTIKEGDGNCHHLLHGNTSIEENDNNCHHLLPFSNKNKRRKNQRQQLLLSPSSQQQHERRR
jgi:hypothetical protein